MDTLLIAYRPLGATTYTKLRVREHSWRPIGSHLCRLPAWRGTDVWWEAEASTSCTVKHDINRSYN